MFKRKDIIVFSPFGNYFGKLRPFVSMSRNMLMFEKKQREKFGFSMDRLKLFILKQLQSISFRTSDGLIFISEYAKKIIVDDLNLKKKNIKIINHGISNKFNQKPKPQFKIEYYNKKNPFKLLYVSDILPYKNHYVLTNSFLSLNKDDFPIELSIVGREIHRKSSADLNRLINKSKNKRVNWKKNIGLDNIYQFYHNADCFIFASSCENMPNILIEAMSSGLPILCSDRGPMREFLKDGGIYYNPESIEETTISLKKIITDVELRKKISLRAYQNSLNFSWNNCAENTFNYLNKFIKN